MKHILRAIWLPLALLIFILLGTFLPIIFRDSLSFTTSVILLIVTSIAGLYFGILLFKALATYTDNAKMIKVLRKIDPTQQQMVNEQRRKEHNAALSHKATRKTINFFGDHLQCTVYAPDYKRAKSFYNQLPKSIKEEGGKFYYSSKGHLHLVSQ